MLSEMTSEEIVRKYWDLSPTGTAIARHCSMAPVRLALRFEEDKRNGEIGKHTPPLYTRKDKQGYRGYWPEVMEWLEKKEQLEK